MRTTRILMAMAIAFIMGDALTGCAVLQNPEARQKKMTSTEAPEGGDVLAPPVIRQPVLPELLVACRGHVLVPALGMTFVPKGEPGPSSGQFLREERVSAPYRIIKPGVRLSLEQSPARLNVELDRANRVIGLYCG